MLCLLLLKKCSLPASSLLSFIHIALLLIIYLQKTDVLTLMNAKKLVSVIFLLLFMTFMTCFIWNYLEYVSKNNDSECYNLLSEQIFQEHLLENTLNMHFTVAHPEAFGITEYTPTLYAKEKEGTTLEQSKVENKLHLLQEISVENLSKNQRFSYFLLIRSLENSLKLSEYPYYPEPLSPSSGSQINLPILLAEYTFHNKRDVEDYLALLSQSRDYFSKLLVYEQEKAAAGYFMNIESLQKVRAQCNSILTKEALNAGTHFLQTSFHDRLVTLQTCTSQDQNTLTPQEIHSYLSENDRLLRTILLPAYEDLSDGLWLLSDHAGSPKGLAMYPNGKDYYETLFRAKTGSYRSIAEIYTMLKERLYQEARAIDEILQNYPESRTLLASKDQLSFSLQEPEQMLRDLERSMATDFPSLPNLSDSFVRKRSAVGIDDPVMSDRLIPSAVLKKVQPNMEAYCAPAFYLSSPMDDTFSNVIYINEKDSTDNLELYTTLAHEGYPGHMYQNVYSNLLHYQNKEDWVRSTLWYGGFMEGWAVYVEFLAYDLAAQKLQEDGHPEEAACVLLAKHNRSLWLCLYTLSDLLVHHDGADVERLEKLFSPFGLTSPEAIASIFQTLVDNPCNYPMYYIGYLEICSLKEDARTFWGDKYSDLAFHTFLLNHGPSDFPGFEDALNDTLEGTAETHSFSPFLHHTENKVSQ